MHSSGALIKAGAPERRALSEGFSLAPLLSPPSTLAGCPSPQRGSTHSEERKANSFTGGHTVGWAGLTHQRAFESSLPAGEGNRLRVQGAREGGQAAPPSRRAVGD